MHRPVRTIVGLTMAVVALIGVTLAGPHVIWWGRGETIDELTRKYQTPEGAPVRAVDWGTCSVVFLGYELSRHDAEKTENRNEKSAIYQRTMSDALADLEAIAMAGSQYVRVGASGDHLLLPNEVQESLDDRYMEAVRATGIPLVLVDCQHAQALGKRLEWDEFCKFQRRRIEYYQRRYHPAVYIVACEPLTYHQFTLASEATFSADAWAIQLREMCQLVKSIDAQTRTGITVLVMDGKDPEWDVWTHLSDGPELDILSVEIYSPENFQQTEDRLAKYGHPEDVGKSFWIAETYNGWALSGKRRWDQDAAWLRVVNTFAQHTHAEAVLVWTFGAFIPGGNYYDFVKGRLHQLWDQGGRLSVVGQEFAALQAAQRP